MRKMLSFCILLIIFLTSCQNSPFGQHTIIDWVDFVKWDGKMYDRIYNGTLADERFIGQKLGDVKFKVADNVSDPEYKVKNGDAAFHEKGTEIYSIKGYPYCIAVKSSRSVNGYDVYFSRDGMKNQWQFQDMPMEKVSSIEIYKVYTTNTPKPIAIINNPEEVSRFLEILKTSQTAVDFQPNTNRGDPDYYHMVFDTGEPIAYMYDLNYDGFNYFWYPSEPAILSNDIQAFFP